MKLCLAHFRSLLFVSCLSFAAENLMDLTDMAIAGHLVGERGLAGVELYGVMTEFLYFVSIIIANGSANLFAAAAGRFDTQGMSRWFSNGLLLAALGGICCAGLSLVVCRPYLAFVGVEGEVLAHARAYWLWYGFQALLQPVAVYLATLVYADGDKRTCSRAFTTELVVNAAASYGLCRLAGIAGCSVGTAIGSTASVAVLLTHFLRKGNALVFCRHFSLRDSWRAVRGDFSESGCALYLVVINALMAFWLVRWFGDGALAVMAVVVMVYEALLFLDGVPNASRVLTGVYVAERNYPGVRDLAREGLAWSVGLGGLVGLFLMVFPQVPVLLLGIRPDSPVSAVSILAVRFVGGSCIFYGVVLYYISYLLFIGRPRLSLALSLLSQNILPVAGFLCGGFFWGAVGFWGGYALAYPVALVLVVLFLVVRRKGDALPYFLPHVAADTLYNDSVRLTQEDACRLSRLTRERLKAAGREARICMRGGLLVEESLMAIYERNAPRAVRVELTVDLRGESRLILRDDGKVGSGEECATEGGDVRQTVLRTVAGGAKGIRDLTATGINRKEFVL